MKTCADYVEAARAALGGPRMSDRELGEKLGGYAQSTINHAKRGRMSDPLAVSIAEAIGAHPGEVLLVAKASREPDEAVKRHLLSFAGKVLGRASRAASLGLSGLAVMLGLWTPRPAEALALVDSVKISRLRRRLAAA